MKGNVWRLFEKIRELLRREEGQDLVECGLVFAMLALGTAVGMESLDVAIVQTFNQVSAVFAAALQG